MIFYSEEMSQLCWVKEKSVVYQTDYEKYKSIWEENDIISQKDNVPLSSLSMIAPESSKDNPLVLLYPPIRFG